MKNFVHANALKLEEIGERIRLRRKKLKYTLEDIEKATGISRKTLIKLEKGGDVRFSTLTTVLSILGLTLDWSDQTKYMFSDGLETEMTVGTKCFLWMGEKKVGEFVCNSQSNQNVFRYSDSWVKDSSFF